MTDNMQRARELLAAECRAEKMGPVATAIEQGMHVSGFADISLRAIAAALRQAAVVPEAKHPDDGNGDDGAYNRGWNDCREAMLATHPAAAVDEAVSRAYDAGFRVAANWMERDDLHAACGSQAYAEDKAAALRLAVPEGMVRDFRRDLTVFCEAIEEGADTALANRGLSDHEEGFHRGSRDAAKRIRRIMYDGTIAAAPTVSAEGER